jgi:HSP20 family protein
VSLLAVLYSSSALPLRSAPGGSTSPWAPPVNLYESGPDLFVEVELPGTGAADVRITCHPGAVVVEGVKGESVPRAAAGDVERFLRVERMAGSFHRVVPLPGPVDASRGRARLRDGLLTITLPRVAEPS